MQQWPPTFVTNKRKLISYATPRQTENTLGWSSAKRTSKISELEKKPKTAKGGKTRWAHDRPEVRAGLGQRERLTVGHRQGALNFNSTQSYICTVLYALISYKK